MQIYLVAPENAADNKFTQLMEQGHRRGFLQESISKLTVGTIRRVIKHIGFLVIPRYVRGMSSDFLARCRDDSILLISEWFLILSQRFDDSTTERKFFQLLAIGYLALLAATWRLWIPQSDFPQVPLISDAGRLSLTIEWSLLLVLVCSLGLQLVIFDSWFSSPLKKGAVMRGAILIVAICTVVLVCIDQHRLQPWAWQFLLLSLVLYFADGSTARSTWQFLIIGIYAWSAWSKLDWGFCTQHGPFLLEGLFKSLGLTKLTSALPSTAIHVLAAMIPLFEFVVAIGLCWSKSRWLAVIGAMIMHFGLLLTLGPLGLQHRPGVLVWNVFFLVQNWILFRFSRTTEIPKGLVSAVSKTIESANEADTSTIGATGRVNEPKRPLTRLGNGLATSLIVAAMLWPVLEPFGLCDHWIAWSVYSAKPERVVVYLHEDELAKLPEQLRTYIGPQPMFDEWYPIRLDRWSLDSVEAPLYPQDRFQIGVTLGLVHKLELQQIRVVIEGPAHWWTSHRVVREYVGLDALENLAMTFRCGARPR